MSKMILVCRQTAIQGHELSPEYNVLDYCKNCPDNGEDCDTSPYWLENNSSEEKT